jgi:HEAT repeat protein
MLKTETAPRVISACLRGAASQLGSKAIPVLVRFLQHEQWQVVAAATELLAGLGKDGAAAVAPLLDDAKLSVRVAADRILGARSQ